ncbi:MAG: dihydrofolate reductase [Clostridia bacterium]|nr:dihydrofolate reductase [Clostridia bacterium]
MKTIVNVDKNWGIGIGDKLLNHIPADMKFFKEKTTGNVVVMGKTTFLTFPSQKALPNRVNIVLTTDREWSAENVIVCHSLDELFEQLERYDTNTVYVIGGSKVYEQLLPYCDTAYVTKVETEKDADRFFPNLDEAEGWVLTDSGEKLEHNGVEFRFTIYRK